MKIRAKGPNSCINISCIFVTMLPIIQIIPTGKKYILMLKFDAMNCVKELSEGSISLSNFELLYKCWSVQVH